MNFSSILSVAYYNFRFKSNRGNIFCCTLSRLVNKKVNRLFLNFRQSKHAVFDVAISKFYQNKQKRAQKALKMQKKK